MLTFLPLGVVGPWQIIIIALVILLLFGGKKIPELMHGLGKGMKSFKEGMNEVEKQIEEVEKMNQNTQNDPLAGPPETIEDADIAMYIDQIEHIDRKIATYPAILAVVKEEAAAYFAGQKSVDDVASVIQNRVMLILQESQ